MGNVIEFLRKYRQETEPTASGFSSDPIADKVAALTLEEFAKRNLVVKVRSNLFNDDMVWVSNPRCLSVTGFRGLAYLPEELEIIYQLPAHSISRIHRLKKLCDGEIVGIRRLTRGQDVAGEG